MRKTEAMWELEKAGLSFTANVIMNGFSKPTRKMATLVSLIRDGHDVRQGNDCYTVLINGEAIAMGALDHGIEAVMTVIEVQKEANK